MNNITDCRVWIGVNGSMNYLASCRIVYNDVDGHNKRARVHLMCTDTKDAYILHDQIVPFDVVVLSRETGRPDEYRGSSLVVQFESCRVVRQWIENLPDRIIPTEKVPVEYCFEIDGFAEIRDRIL